MQDNKTLESPPEVQFAGVSRWLKENLFSSLSSSILTVLSVAAVVSVFRSIIGFFISPEREWTAVTYNLQLYMVQAYPESDFIRVWITVGLLIFLLGLSWGFNSLKEKVLIKEWCDGLLKGISSFLFIVLIAPTNVDVEGTSVQVFNNNTRYICIALGIGLILAIYLLRKTLNYAYNVTLLCMSKLGSCNQMFRVFTKCSDPSFYGVHVIELIST